MKTNFNKAQKVTIGAVIGIGLLNPFSVAVLDTYFKLAYTAIFIVCAVWVSGFVLYKALKPEAVKLPKKSSKGLKLGKLIET